MITMRVTCLLPVLAALIAFSSAAEAQVTMPIKPTCMRYGFVVSKKSDATVGASKVKPPEFPLVFDETEADGGQVLDTAHPLHEFRFTNRSDHVVVPGITAQVGMTYSLSTRSIRPGESGTLSFHIPVGRKAGKLAKYVDVFDTGARELTQKIRFQVDVIPTITTAPEVFSVEVPQGEGATLRTSITGLGIDFEVLPPDSKNLHPMIDVEVGTPLPIMIYERPARRIPVVIRVKPEAPVGPVNASVKFRTNIPARPDVLIQVGVNVVGPLMSRPTRVLFRQTDANDYPFRVVVTARDRMPWMPGAIEVVPIQGGAPTVDWEPSIVDGVFAIILNVHASLNDAEVAPTGNILVRAKGVDHTLTIPYSTVRRPSPRQN